MRVPIAEGDRHREQSDTWSRRRITVVARELVAAHDLAELWERVISAPHTHVIGHLASPLAASHTAW